MAKSRQTNNTVTTTVNVSMRIDPKLKYLIDLLARDQKRTLTGVVEWAIEVAAREVIFFKNDGPPDDATFLDLIDVLWSTDESVRLVQLAICRSSLLDFNEMRIWETIKASAMFWHSKQPLRSNQTTFADVDFEALKLHWSSLLEYVDKHRAQSVISAYSEEHFLLF